MINVLKRFVVSLPYTLPVFVASFTIVAIIFLVTDMFVAAYIWVIGLAFAGVVSLLVSKSILPHIDTSKSSVLWTSVVISLCGVWFAGNTLYTSQHVYVDRDPGIYANTAIWLVNHTTLHIEADGVHFDHDKVNSEGAGFAVSLHNEREVSAQGAHALPALLALAGKIVGIGNMFHVMPLFGAVALLTFYGFLRLFVKKHKWSVAGVVLLALSLPLLYFSRDVYSEPLALILTFGALPLLYFAQKTGSKAIWVTAGLVAGAGALTRIDALLAIGGMVAVAFVIVNLAPDKRRRQELFGLMLFLVTLAAIYGLAYYDLVYLSSSYLAKHFSLIKPQIVVVVGIVTVGLLATMINFRTKQLANFYNKYKKKIAIGAAYGTGLIGIVLFSRPLWYVGYGTADNPLVRAAQLANGLPVDGWRKYAENSVEWITWYVGGVTVLLAFIGLIMVVRKMCVSQNILYISLVAVVGGAAIVYLNVPSITPDHIWASRRFLPVVIPGVIVLAVYTLASMESVKQKLPQSIRRHVTPALFGLFSMCLVATAITTQPFVATRTYDNQLTQVEQVCDVLPENAALLLYGGQTFMAVQTFRSVCGIEVGYIPTTQELSSEMIKQINTTVQKDGRRLYIGAVATNTYLLSDNGINEPFNTSTFQEYEPTLIRRPQFTVTRMLDIYMGEVTKDGRVVPVEMHHL